MPPDIQATMGVLQAVAIRAQDPEILEPVIIALTIDVVEFKGNASVRCALCPTTKLAALVLQTGAE